MKTKDGIDELIVILRSKDGTKRERARKSIVKLGKPAVSTLIGLLSDKSEHMRWEACKALGCIKDPPAASALVDALRDRSMEIQWLAAEGLIALGRKAIVPLLQSLTAHFDSIFLRQGAHHVLHALERDGLLSKEGLAVLDTLRTLGPTSAVGVRAHQALESLKEI